MKPIKCMLECVLTEKVDKLQTLIYVEMFTIAQIFLEDTNIFTNMDKSINENINFISRAHHKHFDDEHN